MIYERSAGAVAHTLPFQADGRAPTVARAASAGTGAVTDSPVDLAALIRPGVSRGLDFVRLEALEKRTGVPPPGAVRFAMTELVFNALDKVDATEVGICLRKEPDPHGGKGVVVLRVGDNGSVKLAKRDVELIANFDNEASAKRGLFRVSRGYLGNALKCVTGYSFALFEAARLTPHPVVFESHGYRYSLTLEPDWTRGRIGHTLDIEKIEDDGSTRLVVRFPDMPDLLPAKGYEELVEAVVATGLVNLGRRFVYEIFGTKGTMEPIPVERKARRVQESSVLWYREREFLALADDFRRAAPGTRLGAYVSLFRGFSGKRIQRETFEAAGEKLRSPRVPRNHDTGTTGDGQFFPATPLSDLSTEAVRVLFGVMRRRAKPIAKRSIPSILGSVGRESFEKTRERNGWPRLRYDVAVGATGDCSRYHPAGGDDGACDSPDHVRYPFLLELAVFDRKPGDRDGLRVYQCVNFAASDADVFAGLYDVRFHLAQAGVRPETPVTVVAHYVSPVLKWLNYGKSSLGEG
jgi:hypothetical protein